MPWLGYLSLLWLTALRVIEIDASRPDGEHTAQQQPPVAHCFLRASIWPGNTYRGTATVIPSFFTFQITNLKFLIKLMASRPIHPLTLVSSCPYLFHDDCSSSQLLFFSRLRAVLQRNFLLVQRHARIPHSLNARQSRHHRLPQGLDFPTSGISQSKNYRLHILRRFGRPNTYYLGLPEGVIGLDHGVCIPFQLRRHLDMLVRLCKGHQPRSNVVPYGPAGAVSVRVP